jgi:hypothetical protein
MTYLVEHQTTMNGNTVVVSGYNRDAIKYSKGKCFSEKRRLKYMFGEYFADEDKRNSISQCSN